MKLVLFILLFSCQEKTFKMTPDHTSFSGEITPLYKSEIWELWDREYTILAHDEVQVALWFKRASRFFPYIEKRLKEEGIPDDFKYLAVAESSLLQSIRSYVGARGIWQFMPRTGRKWGLKINRKIDERLDFHKSTETAIKFLKHLYTHLENWTLVAASYNAGLYRVKKYLREQKADNFYDMALPEETERYLFKIMAIKKIFKDRNRYPFSFSQREYLPPLNIKSYTLNFTKDTLVTDLTTRLGISYKSFKKMNLHILSKEIPKGKQIINIPKEIANLISEKETALLQ